MELVVFFNYGMLDNIYIYIWLVVSTPLKNMKVRLDHHPNY